MTPDQINTFQSVAGISPQQVNLCIRTLAGSCLFFWATWMCQAFISHLRTERGSVGDILSRLFRVGIVLMLGIILIR